MDSIFELIGGVLASEDFKKAVVEKIDIADMAEKECFKLLREIRGIIRNHTLSDSDCFDQIEEIVCILEQRGIDCGARHDF